MERRAIRTLRERKEIVIIPADKGNSTVVMSKKDYMEKLEDVLSDECFSVLKKDNTACTQRRLVAMLKEVERRGEISRSERLRLTSSAPVCPTMYGLPKVHKNSVPLRPVVSCIDSPTYYVQKLLVSILRPLLMCSPYVVKNSEEFCNVLSQRSLDHDDLMLSFDVVNLFNRVPAVEACQMTLNMLGRDEGLSERTNLSLRSIESLLRLCIECTTFECMGSFYKTSTCPIGAPLSPVLASVFMIDFEMKCIPVSPVPVKTWIRFVDDTYAVVKRGQEEVVLQYLNGVHNSIKFTCEVEEGGSLPFLDVLVTRGEDGVLKTTVFRKKTHTNRYLNFRSCHSVNTKWGVVKSMVRRAQRVCSDESALEEELRFLEKVFSANGFPRRGLRKVVRKCSGGGDKLENDRQEGWRVMRLPYLSGLSERLRRRMRRFGFKVWFTKGRTLGSILSRPKLRQKEALEEAGVVYTQGCKDCDKVYVGESGRRASCRKAEHQKCVRDMDMRSAIAQHVHEQSHRPDSDSFKVILKEKDWRRRKIKESLVIRQARNFNRDVGVDLKGGWRGIFNCFRPDGF